MKIPGLLARVAAWMGVGSLGVSLSFFPLQSAALAQTCNIFGCSPPGAAPCNPFGCPQPGAGECNPFGCPNPGAAACTVSGCPAAPPSRRPDPPSSNASQRPFAVRNNTNQAIDALYLSPSSDSSWGANEINSSLFGGNSVSFTLTGACDWDLRVELANGQSLEQLRIDTCLNNSYTVGSNASSTGGSNQPQPQIISPVASAGPYWVYQKPAHITNSQMEMAGARFYSGPEACSVHFSLCTSLSGSWLSQQPSLSIGVVQGQPKTSL